MRKIIVLYAVALAALLFLLKMLEYRYLVHDLSVEFYISIVASLFTAVGIWLGLKLTRKKKVTIVAAPKDFNVDEALLRQTGISKREYEVLELMARGYSNQEIADKLFVSLNTVKTHSSNLFVKLDAKRRTQAIQKAKELALIP